MERKKREVEEVFNVRYLNFSLLQKSRLLNVSVLNVSITGNPFAIKSVSVVI